MIDKCTTHPTPDDKNNKINAQQNTNTKIIDTKTQSCTDNPKYDDNFPCTLDTYVIKNICDHTPLNNTCTTEEQYVINRDYVSSTPTEYETDTNYNNNTYYNNAEHYLGPTSDRTYLTDTTIDYDNDNTCTTNMYNDTIDNYHYTTAPNYDTKTSTLDNKTPYETFDKNNYTSNFSFQPSATTTYTKISFNMSEITISISNDVLTMRADHFTLTQSPAPTDNTFDIHSSDNCATVQLENTFTYADR